MAEYPKSKWFKSSYSGNPQNECVECANQPHAFKVRDSKNPKGPSLSFTHAAWDDFTGALRDNGFVQS
ncbi:DUF397 domain-containing protein [Streptomyces sp. NPDC050161]|uniref:DUF397 domain-containing protein n=1 Tax=Streptomyces sp. NPDC050161 TaxID=3365604 RepID=UPI0037AA2C93